MCTWTRTCAGRTARSTCCAASRTRSPTPSTSAFGYHCAAQVARIVGDSKLAEQFEQLATRWVNAFDPATGLLIDSTFYEGGRWNYSFRLSHDMQARIELAGGDDRFAVAAGQLLRVRRRPGQAGRRAAERRRAGRRVRPQPVRGTQQRAGHGGPVGLPLRRPAGPHRRDRACGGAQPVRPRPRRAARQRRLRRTVVVVRLGEPRAVPGGRAGPLPDQRALVRPLPDRSRWARADHQAPGFVEPTPGGPTQYVQSVRFNGHPLEQSWLPARDLQRGGQLEITLGPTPSGWSRDHRPPSVSRPGTGYPDVSSAPLPAEVTA